jgi:hypothetical protein
MVRFDVVAQGVFIMSMVLRKFNRRFALLLVVVALVSYGQAARVFAQIDKPISVSATELEATNAVQWMQLLYKLVQAEAVNPAQASRVYAYAGVTLYESVLPGIEGNNSLAGQLNGLTDLPLPEENVVYDWPSSMNAGLSTVLSSLFANAKDSKTKTAITDMRATQAGERKKAVSADVIEHSLAYGDKIGEALLKWIAQDNFKETRDKAYTSPTGEPFLWEITTPGTKPVEPYWGMIRPFTLKSSDVCDAALNMPFSTDPDSAFYAQANEVKTVKDELTNEQKAIANFWVDTPGLTGAPAGHWVSIASQMVDHLKLKLSRAAEMYAMVGVALGDAFIGCWDLKYRVNLVRPETYIKKYISRNWAPYIQTPPFPEYPSGHSVGSGAASEVLTGMFGVVAYKDDTHRSRGLPARSFTSFEAAANEAAISRLYGGIHYRVAIENGLRIGRCIGQRVLERVQMRPIGNG